MFVKTITIKKKKIDCLLPSQEFDSNPVVHVTAVHENRRNKHDATSVWVEDISTKKFKTCFREIKNFNGIHRNLFVVSNHIIEGVSSL